MGKLPSWFERKFEFTLSLGLLPNLCTRLRGTPARLEETLSRSTHQTLVSKHEGKWSAQEHVGHLLDLEPLWSARIEDYVTSGSELTPTDLANRKTDEANHNARPLQEILSEFRASRFRLLARIEELDSSLFGLTLPHPRLKTPMRLLDHLYFVAEHDDHHLARIWELTQQQDLAALQFEKIR